MPASWDTMPSYQSFVMNQIGAPQPSAGMENQIPANLGFGAGDFTSDDFAGFNTNTNPNPNDLAFNYSLWGGSNNTVNPYGADVSGQNYYMPGLEFNYSMPGFGYTNFFNTPGAGEGYGGGLLGGSTRTDAPTILDRYTVTGTRVDDLGLLNFDPNATYFGPRNPIEIDQTGGGAGFVVNTGSQPTMLTPFVVTDTRVNSPSVEVSFPPEIEPSGVNVFTPPVASEGPTMLTPFVVTDTRVNSPSVEVSLPPDLDPGVVNVFRPPVITEGPVVMTPFVVSADRVGSASVSQGPIVMTPFVVSEDRLGSDRPIVMTPFVVTENRISSPSLSVSVSPSVSEGPVIMTPFVVSGDRVSSPSLSVSVSVSPPIVSLESPIISFTTPRITSPQISSPRVVTTPSVSVSPIISTNVGGGGTGSSTGGTTASSRRNLAAELEESMRALRANQGNITGMYKDLYNAFMPEGLTAAEASSLAQMRADEEKLARLRAGILSPEDVRTGQQAAREAYAARGQIMGPGAIGAEIYNRENIRQAREDAARAAYQQSMGNVLNTANLKTGNIFAPISSLISNTFNPLGTYPADVYGTNVNADLAREIAQKNYEAAIESARLSGNAARSSSNTNLFADIIRTGGAIKVALACMPGDQVIDTPSGPKPIKDLRGGDEVIGYDGSVKIATQVCSYVENPDREFFTFTLDDGRSLTVCGNHRIMDIPASEWVVGAKMGDREVKKIDYRTGVSTSYDLVTEIGGYQIAGIPVNSMIPEMLALTMSLVALKHA